MISCSADDKTGSGENKGGNHSKSELAGTWNPDKMPSNRRGNLRISTNGWLGLVCNGNKQWTSVGKLDDTFDYPYTVEIVLFSQHEWNNEMMANWFDKYTGKITFHDALTCTADFYDNEESYGAWRKLNISFKKKIP